MWKPFAAGVLAALALAASARADTHIQYVDAIGNPGSQLFVRDGKVRLEPGAGGPAVLYDSASGTFTTLDAGQHAYTVFDRATMDQVGQRVRAARMTEAARSGRLTDAQRRAIDAMAHMTSEQRALLEKMVGGLPGLGRAPEMAFVDQGTTREIAGATCREVEVQASRLPVARVCVAALDALPIAPLDRATLQTMHEGIQEMMRTMGPATLPVPDLIPQGLALEIEPGGPANAPVQKGEILRAISGDKLPEGLFEVPAGFTRQEVPEPE